MIKVAFLTNIIAPYRVSFFNHLEDYNKIDLKIFYCAEQEKNRSWKTYFDEIKYKCEILKDIHISTKKRTIHINYGLFSKLVRFKPDVLVIGTDILSTTASWFALIYAKINGIKVIRYEGSHKYTVTNIKKLLYRFYYQFFDGFFIYSILTKEFLISLGIPSLKIAVGYNVGDTSYFSKKIKEYLDSGEYSKERAKFPEVLFLFVGRLCDEKNILGLLNILSCYDWEDAGLFILGDGPLRKEVSNIARRFKKIKIYYEGFRHKDECIRYFCLSDIFILPTLLDPASIVLSEALISGNFVIGSKYDGSSHNFIINGENGFIIDPLNESEFKNAVYNAYMLCKNKKIDKEKIKFTMKNYTIGLYAERFFNILQKIKS